jgi:anti-anti-sigma factor
MAQSVFKIEEQGNVLILTPFRDLRELEFDAIEVGAESVMQLLGQKQAQHVVIDFHNTDYFGSTALGFFVKLWKRIRATGGEMVFCGLSDHEREVLRVTRLDTLWSICKTRAEALTLLSQ